MTRRINLSYGTEVVTSTSITNNFIDNYMADANGSYVKVYIYLMRCLNDPSMDILIPSIAEKLEETERDIIRALRYWESKNLLEVSYDADGDVSSIVVIDIDKKAQKSRMLVSSTSGRAGEDVAQTPAPATRKSSSRTESKPSKASAQEPASVTVTEKPTYTPMQIAGFKDFDERFNALIDHIEDTLGRTLTNKNLQLPAYLFESLGFDPELIEYLYDTHYFKENGTITGEKYLEKIARDWYEKGIRTVEEAKLDSLQYSKNYSIVAKSFGIKNRALGTDELGFLSRWNYELKVPQELLQEACTSALSQKGDLKHIFEYTDRILTSWAENGITTLEQAKAEHEAHVAATKVQSIKKAGSGKQEASIRPVNTFTNFPQRQYSDDYYEELEKRKLGF